MKSLFKCGLFAAAILMAGMFGAQSPIHSKHSISIDSEQVIHSVPAERAFSLIPAAMAEEPAPVASPAPVDSPSFGEKIGAFLQKIADMIPLDGTWVVILAFVYDFIRRKWPTANAASLYRDVKAVIQGMIAFLGKVDQFFDKLFGQNVAK